MTNQNQADRTALRQPTLSSGILADQRGLDLSGLPNADYQSVLVSW